jgi:hypothetical protein
MADADTYIESVAADLARLAGRTPETWPRRFYSAAASALNRVRRAYLDEMTDAALGAAKPPHAPPDAAATAGGAS